jgi:MinD superfamily P-loop ATPase
MVDSQPTTTCSVAASLAAARVCLIKAEPRPASAWSALGAAALAAASALSLAAAVILGPGIEDGPAQQHVQARAQLR